MPSPDGPLYCGTASSDSSNGGVAPWDNPTDAQGTSNGADTTVTVDSGDESEYMKCLNFGFSVPDATVDGITVEIDKYCSGTNGKDAKVRIVKGGTIGSTEMKTATSWPNGAINKARTTYGASNNLWGDTYSESDVNSSTFGVAISVTTAGSAREFHIDDVRITIHYTAAGGGTYTATAAINLAAVTLAATGTRGDVGTSAITLAPVTLSGTGDHSEHGVGAITLAAVTLEGTGTRGDVGTGAITLAPVTLAGTGDHSEHGVGAITRAAVTCAGTGAEVSYIGGGAITLAAVTLAGGGAHSEHGAGAITLAAVTLAGSGDHVEFIGTGTITLGAVTLAGTGAGVAYVGTAGITLAAVTLSGGGATNAVDPLMEGQITLAAVTLAGDVEFSPPVYDGTGGITLAAVTLAASGAEADFVALSAITLAPVTLASTGIFVPTLNFTAVGGIVLGAVTCTGTATFSPALERFPCLGGFRVTAYGWVSQGALVAEFTSNYSELCIYQMYAGRTLVGVSDVPADRSVVGAVFASHWPQHITILAVEQEDRLTDFGSLLPLRPYNRVKMTWSTATWDDDAKYAEITGSSAPDEAVDATNVLSLELFDTDGSHTFLTDPLPGSGNWQFEIAGRDQRPPDGNRGDPLELEADILATPPDVQLHSDGTRLTAAVDAGVLTVNFDYDF